MAAVSKQTVFVKGKLNWAKVLGEPRLNYNQDAREWTFELEPDEEGLKVLNSLKLADRIKGKGYNIGQKGQFAEKNPFIILKKPELTKDGEKNKPIRIYDVDDQPWDEETLLGNETEAYVKIDVRNYGPGKKSGVYPVAIKVTKLVEYHSSEFGGVGDFPAAPPKKTAEEIKKSNDELLDDPLP